MQFLILLLSAFFASCAFATPTATPTCLTDAKATAIVKQFRTLLMAPQGSTFNSTANSLLADNFSDTSDSVDILAQIPLNTTTFPSKFAFIAGQGSQPPIPVLTTLDIFHSCHKIAWRWVATGVGLPNSTAEVKGINTFEVGPKFKITKVFSEFNSAAWLQDLGNPECQAHA